MFWLKFHICVLGFFDLIIWLSPNCADSSANMLVAMLGV